MLNGRNRTGFATMTVVMFLASWVGASAPGSWQGLVPGQYAAGFTTVEKFDYSRTFSASEDYFGNPIEGEPSRPIQLCIWYPAVADEAASRMIYGQYAFPFPEDSRFIGILSALQNRENQTLGFLANGDNGVLMDVINTEMAAVRDAEWAEGKFPLVIFHADLTGGYAQHAVLCEYLASHGFVVATTHTLGTRTVNVGVNAVDVESVARDKEFLLAELRAYPGIDVSSVGLVGTAFGSVSALVQQMRSSEIDAVVTLLGSTAAPDRKALVESIGHYQAIGMTVPLLQLYPGSDSPMEQEVAEGLPYSERFAVERASAQARDFFSYSFLLGPLMASDSMIPDYRHYLSVCEDVLQFMRAKLTGNAEAEGHFSAYPVSDGVTFLHREGDDVPPTAEQFVAIIQQNGVPMAVELVEKFGLFSSERQILDENTVNMLGYRYMQMGQVQESRSILEWATKGFPQSANVWDSFGEACMSMSDYETALASYRHCAELLNDPNDNTQPAMRDGILANLPATIERLEQLVSEQAQGAAGGN